MKIVELHDEAWDSGIAHYAVTLSAALRERGHEVLFWTETSSHSSLEAKKLGLETREIANRWVSLPALREEIRKRGVELINAHTGSAHSLAAILAAGTSVRVVRTRGDTRAPSGHFLAQALAARTSAYIAANSRLRDELAETYPGARVEVVFQGIATPGDAAPLPSDPVTIGVVGRLDEVKGHMVVIEAAARLAKDFPAAQFRCAGPDPSGRQPMLIQRVARHGLGDSFRFLGKVAGLAPFLNSCRIGVVASTGSEAVSRAALEWMALGRPVVATRVGCLPDLVEDGRTGLLVPPKDPEALAKALERLLLDGRLAAELGRAGRKRFEENFSLARFAEETERVYRSVLA